MSDWQDTIQPAADKLFRELREEFSLQRIKHLLVALERQLERAERGELVKRWRGENSVETAARRLGLSVEDVQSLEDGTKRIAPVERRKIFSALAMCREELRTPPRF